MAHRRHIINEADELVSEALEGFGIAHRQLLEVDVERRIVLRRSPKRGQVGLLSGGGAGHEPLHAGFVGPGMLDVAVSGAVFASPTAVQIHEGTKRADSGSGVLHIVKNYTGDVINFAMAADLAEDDGIEVATVVVDDDLATAGAEGGPGRRGTAAVIAVEKICGAAAEAGMPLAQLAELGTRITGSSRTLGIALEAGTLPGRSEPSFELAAEEVEFGVGIHGERGRGTVAFRAADRLVDELLESLLEVVESDRLLVIVNGLGSTTPLELNVVARRVSAVLQDRGRTAERWLVGPLVTSLDMRGVSITLVPLDDELLALWDAPVRTPALSW